MESTSTESRIILAIQALKQDPKLSVRRATEIYKVPRSTLRDRRVGRVVRREMSTNSKALTDLEEEAIVQRILDLDTRGFQPRQSDVREMANCLRADRDASPVGPRWAENFVRRQPKLSMAFRRQIDYQRAKCEDPTIVQQWFDLVRNVISKYGIEESDIYNFDETGFIMGMLSTAKVVTSSERHGKPRTKQPGNREWVTVIQCICTTGWVVPSYIVVKGKCHLSSWYDNGQFPKDWRLHTSENGWTTNEIGLDWIRHFNEHTKDCTKGVYRLLILDGHGSHHSVAFEEYCRQNNIITLCMPPHSSHFLQPLDVGCFGPLKTAYGKQIEKMMRMQITHITKDDFLAAYLTAHNTAMITKNIQSGFRATGLAPYDPESVIERLDPKPHTPTPPTSRPGSRESWVTKTPQTSYDIMQQSTTIKKRIASHQNSSPTQMYNLVDAQARGLSKMAHELVLLRAEIKDVREANEVLSKRRRAKKTRLRQGGSLSFQEVEDLQAEKEVDTQLNIETRRTIGPKTRDESRARRCGACGNTGHNARTCETITVVSEEENSE
jgi:DDE superfamily endonuclease